MAPPSEYPSLGVDNWPHIKRVWDTIESHVIIITGIARVRLNKYWMPAPACAGVTIMRGHDISAWPLVFLKSCERLPCFYLNDYMSFMRTSDD